MFSCLAGIAAVALLWLGRFHTFTADEADFLGRSLTVADVLRPHNEHLSALPVIAYRLLVESVGTGSYLPFLGLLVALHLVASAGVLALIPGRVGVLAAAVMLFLGSGYENLFWAFQIGYVGSVAAGLWAMAVRRAWLAAGLVGIAIACSGIGLIFVVPVALLQRRGAIWLAVPCLGYAAWWLWFGVGAAHGGTLVQTLEWAIVGIGWAFGSVFGVGLAIGLGLAAALVVLARRGDRLAIAALTGLVGEYVLIAIARSGMEVSSFAAAPRYVYVAAPFILIALAGCVRERRLLVAAYAVALVVNLVALPVGAVAW